jgi:hypothetical protein
VATKRPGILVSFRICAVLLVFSPDAPWVEAFIEKTSVSGQRFLSLTLAFLRRQVPVASRECAQCRLVAGEAAGAYNQSRCEDSLHSGARERTSFVFLQISFVVVCVS